MLKKLFVLLSLCCAALAYAAVDVNQASEAELDGIKGIGPAMSARILQEREKAPFKDWADLIERVQGVGEGSAARLSAEGLRVNGRSFKKAKAPKTPRKQREAQQPSAAPSAQPPAVPASAAQ